jgi:hypothetical protein
MQRKPLFLIIPVIAVIVALVLFFQRDNTGQPQSTASSSGAGLTTGSGAHMPPTSSLNPTPAGTPSVSSPGNAPASATPSSPSGEAARPAERR